MRCGWKLLATLQQGRVETVLVAAESSAGARTPLKPDLVFWHRSSLDAWDTRAADEARSG